jgi:ABC-type nickel/cobalt efflux system permease component RcnA
MVGWLALALSLLSTGAALAHPLGNFTINRYSRIELANEEARLLYIVDMAEIPTFRLRSEIDANGDGVIDPQEQALYANQLASNLQENLQLTVNAQNIALDLDAVSLEFPPGQANLPTLRFQAHFRAALPQAAQNRLEFVDANYAGQLGWQEVIIRAAQSVELLQTSAPSVDRSNELRNYPSDLLNNPPAVHNAQVEYRLAFSGRAHNNQGARQQTDSALQSISETALALGKPADGFANLITLRQLNLTTVALALLAAFVWGAAHALSPGHGKAIVGAYLVGARGTTRHAIFLGLTTTITHTAGVFALGMVTLFASRFILPQTLYPWLGVFSGLLVVGMGLSLSWRRLRSYLGLANKHSHVRQHQHTEHPDALYHDHGDGHYHSHVPPAETQVTWRTLLALGVSGGLLPCPSALVLMLGAITLQRVGFGLLLIVVFSLGLASVLSLIGVALVKTRTLFDRIPTPMRLASALPMASAVFITILGIGVTWQALLSTGILS